MRLASLLVVVSSLASAEGADFGLPLTGEEAESFLRNAAIVSRKPIGIGITRPEKVTLSDGIRTHHAVWKTVNEFRHGLKRSPGGGVQIGETDSYRYEIAAYELDRLLGLELVPPTVLREIDGRQGSLQLWVERGFDELERRELGLEAPDVILWSNRLSALRIFQHLIYDSDFKNIRNILYDESFRIYSIDHSRAFRTYSELLEEQRLLRFSRDLLAQLSSLERNDLDAALGQWLSEAEIEGVLARRSMILTRAASLVDDLGAERVIYP